MGEMLHYLSQILCEEKRCMKYKGGPSFVTILTIGTIVGEVEFKIIFKKRLIF